MTRRRILEIGRMALSDFPMTRAQHPSPEHPVMHGSNVVPLPRRDDR